MSFYAGVWNNPTAVPDDQARHLLRELSDEKSVELEFDGTCMPSTAA
jgi:hypothetical protein